MSGSKNHCKNGLFRILMVNDVYTFYPQIGTGGFAQLAGMLPKYRTPNSLFAVMGDFMGGSRLAQRTKGAIAVEVLNEMKCDMVCVGNHEFDYGADHLSNLISSSTFPWLGGNIRDRHSGNLWPGITDMYIKDVTVGEEGQQFDAKIGFFGLCTPATPSLAWPGPDVEFTDVIEAANVMVAALKAQGADIIVGLTHLKVAMDQQLAESVQGLDLILGGHDHTPYLLQAGSDGVFIIKCGENADYLGVIDLCIKQTGQGNPVLSSVTSDQRPEKKGDEKDRDVSEEKKGGRVTLDNLSYQMLVNKGYPLDEGVCNIIDTHVKAIEAQEAHMNLDSTVLSFRGSDPIVTTSHVVRTQGVIFGTIVAEAMKRHHTQEQGNCSADLAIINGGFIRASRVYDANTDLTIRQMREELPFERHTVNLRMAGTAIKKALEFMLKAAPVAVGCFPHPCLSLQVEFDAKLPPLQRITRMTYKGKPFDEKRYYNVVTTDFIAAGGDENDNWKEHSIVKDNVPQSSVKDIVLRQWQLVGTVDTDKIRPSVSEVSQ